METNYQKFLSGEYCNRLDKEVFDMIVRNKRLLAEFNSTDISDSKARTALLHELGNIEQVSETGKIVKIEDLLSVFNELIYEVSAYEAGTTKDC